jgi:hypothetical protein
LNFPDLVIQPDGSVAEIALHGVDYRSSSRTIGQVGAVDGAQGTQGANDAGIGQWKTYTVGVSIGPGRLCNHNHEYDCDRAAPWQEPRATVAVHCVVRSRATIRRCVDTLRAEVLASRGAI